MSYPLQDTERRLLELLADRAAFGLDGEEEHELRQLLQAKPDFDGECIERAAATVHLAFTSVEPLPATGMRAAIRCQPRSWNSVTIQGLYHFKELVGKSRVGDKVKIVVIRGSKDFTLEVLIGNQ